MIAFLLRRWLGSGSSSEANRRSVSNSTTHSLDSSGELDCTTTISDEDDDFLSIDLNHADEFDSLSYYGTPRSTLDRRHARGNRFQRSSRPASSLSYDSSLEPPVPVFMPQYVDMTSILCAAPLPPIALIPVQPIDQPPLLPEIDEFDEPLPQPRHFSMPHRASLPEYHFQFQPHNDLVDRLMPLTTSPVCTTRDRRFEEFAEPPEMRHPHRPSMQFNRPTLFQEEQELAEDYIEGGYAPLNFGTKIGPSNYVVRKLGFGHFSTVWLCYNTTNKNYVAVKVSRSNFDYAQTCLDEIRFLKRIADASSQPGADRVASLIDEFGYISPFGAHRCAALEPLGRSLYQLIVQTGQLGFGLPVIRKLAQQILEGLRFLHDECGIIHTDVKPENITINSNHQNIHELTRTALTDHALGRWTPFAHAHTPDDIRNRLERANAVVYYDSVCRLEKTRKELLKAVWQDKFEGVEGSYEEFVQKVRKQAADEEFEVFTEQESEVGSDDEGDDVDSFLMDENTSFKIVDLGTAQYRDNIVTTEVQTLQYRSPEAILSAEIGPAIDIWSVACVLFEAATGDYLFNPRGNSFNLHYNRAAHEHFCCFISIMGSPPRDLGTVFAKSRIYKKLFDENGKFIHEPHFGSPSLAEHIKRQINEPGVTAFVSFMERMLCFNPMRRASAEELLRHKWLHPETSDV
uniref:non-specific serine/threonine protein kinase n=1 Tax=Panagrellus redivivus TaxID=6233 RepID=A0A7E4UZG5_PANRE